MSKDKPAIQQALVKWNRFGDHKEGILGDTFEDKGERLAIVYCPYCNSRRALEYHEYMHLLRLNKVPCHGCKQPYTLRPISALRKKPNEDDPDDDPKGPGVSRPTEGPDPLGRRDWGKA